MDYDRIERVHYSNQLIFGINVHFPSRLSKTVVEKRFSAAALLHRGIANLLEVPTLAQYLYREGDWSKVAFNAGVGWVPRLQDIYFDQLPDVTPGDPILYLEFRGQRFLVDAWEIAEEHPVSALIHQYLQK